MSILPFRHSSPAGCEEHTVLCDSVLHSNQPPSQLWTPISRDISHPFPFPAAHNLSPIGRSSLPLYMQGSSAGSVAGPTSTTDLGAEQARFGYVSPPASTTHNYSGIAGTGYRECNFLPRHYSTFLNQLTISPRSAFHRTIASRHFQHSTQPTDLTHTTQCRVPLGHLHPFRCFPAGVQASPSMLDIVETIHHLCNMITSSLHRFRPGLASLILPQNRPITLITGHQYKRNQPVYICTDSAKLRPCRQRRRLLLSCLDHQCSTLLIPALRRPTTRRTCTGCHLLNLTQFIGTHPQQARVSP